MYIDYCKLIIYFVSNSNNKQVMQKTSSYSVKSMQIQAGQNMPLAGFYGSELMNAANELGCSSSSRNETNNKNNTEKGHYFGRVPAPTPPDLAPSAAAPALQCNRLPGSVAGQLVAPANTCLAARRAHAPTAHFFLCNNRNNLSPGPD